MELESTFHNEKGSLVFYDSIVSSLALVLVLTDNV